MSDVKKYQDRTLIGLIGLQGLLLVLGDMGCYLAWRCTSWLNWHGYLGLAFLGAALSMTAFVWVRNRVV